MQYFTGSKAHNIRTRTIAVHLGLKLSEYGLFETESDKRVASPSSPSCVTESARHNAVGSPRTT
jgi:DNA polymerase (family 10)